MKASFDGQGMIIHANHQPLQYLQSQNKLQQARDFKWVGFLQQFILVIRYKKGIYNKFVDLLSSPIVNTSFILKHNSIMHERYIEKYSQDDNFKDVYATLIQGNHVNKLDYHVDKKFFLSS